MVFGVWILIAGYGLYLPKNIDRSVIAEITNYDEINVNEVVARKRKALKRFYIHYQVFIRNNLNEETTKFIERRWTSVYVHGHNIIAILIAFLISICNECTFDLSELHFLKRVYIILLLMFLILNAVLYRNSYYDAVNVEYEAVKKIIKDRGFRKYRS